MASPWPGGTQDPTPPNGSWGVPYGGGAPQREKGASRALILGIVSFFCLPIVFGPAAIHEGTKARKAIAQSGGMLTGDGLALAGVILGAIGLIVGSAWTIYAVTSG